MNSEIDKVIYVYRKGSKVVDVLETMGFSQPIGVHKLT